MCGTGALTLPFDPLHTKVIRGSKTGRQILDPIGLDKQMNPDKKPYKKDAAAATHVETAREADARRVAAEADRNRFKNSMSTDTLPASTSLG